MHELPPRLKPAAAPLLSLPRRAGLRLAAAAIGLLAGAGAAGWLASRGMPADDASETASVTTLLTRIDDADDAVRRAAAESLRRDHGRSPIAVGLTVGQLRWATFAALNPPGRIERLVFLLASDDAAWTAEARREAGQALRGLNDATAAGRLRLTPAVSERLARLGQRLGAG